MAGADQLDAESALDALDAALDRLLAADVASLDDDRLLGWIGRVERLRRRAEALDHPVVAELDRRSLPERLLTGTAHRLLATLWRVNPAAAKARVSQARALSPRVTVSGAVLPPLLPVAAAARRDGAIGGEHVRVVLATLHALPAALPVPQVEAAERILTDAARSLDPATLSGVGRRLRDTLDPDGNYRDEADQQRRRGVSLHDTGDGMIRLHGDLDAETGALALTVLNALSAPQPTRDATDPRTPAQRRHDALRHLLARAVGSGQLPSSGGTPATVLITMTAEQFETKTGLAATSYGQKLTVPTALRLADQAAIGWIVHNGHGGVLNYGTTRRIASPRQTLALIARDRGCAFPDCDRPPEWTERHHITPRAHGGATDLENLVLLCDRHHDRHREQGWTIAVRDAVPWFTPPAWQDPTRTPIRHSRFATRHQPA
jgi:hypothetical protein